MSDLQETLREASEIADGLAVNKVKNFAYTDAAYQANDVAGVPAFDFSKEQNIPDTAHTELSDSVANKGARAQAVSLPRNALNHFFGRMSYNLNKVTDILKVILPLFSRVISSGGNRYDPSAEYEQFDEVTFIDTHDTIDSVPKVKSFKRKSNTPTLLVGVPPIDANGIVNSTHWQECYAQVSHLIDTAVHGATNNNVPNRIVSRDENGDFVARIVIAALTGNADTATLAANATKLANILPGDGGKLLLALSALSSLAPAMNGAASAGSSNIPARQDHVHPTDTSRLAASAYTAADILAKLLTVDSDTAGINATTLKSITPGAGGLSLLALSTLGSGWATLLAAAKPTTLDGYGITENYATTSKLVAGSTRALVTGSSVTGAQTLIPDTRFYLGGTIRMHATFGDAQTVTILKNGAVLYAWNHYTGTDEDLYYDFTIRAGDTIKATVNQGTISASSLRDNGTASGDMFNITFPKL